MGKKLVGTGLSLIFVVLFLFVHPIYATKFDLIPPSGELARGEDITFTINIDTEGIALTSIQSGLTYDATLLQYVSVTTGDAMNSVVADTTTYGAGKILFTGTNNAGYNGTGVFATVIFKIIAQSSGETEICSLWLPTPTPTPTTPAPTSYAPTSAPQPTALPQTGGSDSRNAAIIFAVSFLAAAGGVLFLSQRHKYSFPEVSSKKHGAKTKIHKKT